MYRVLWSSDRVDGVPNTIERRADDWQSLWCKQENEQHDSREQLAQVRHQVKGAVRIMEGPTW